MAMDDLMARTMVENLSIGIDPITGKLLPKQDCCANELVQEALKMVLEHCSLESYATLLEREHREKKEAAKARKAERAEKYPNQGAPWSDKDDWKLRALYNNGYSIPHIANTLKRSPQAISGRIKKLLAKG